jgi:hypothetical protein
MSLLEKWLWPDQRYDSFAQKQALMKPVSEPQLQQSESESEQQIGSGEDEEDADNWSWSDHYRQVLEEMKN